MVIKGIRSFVTGVLIGSFTYLLVLVHSGTIPVWHDVVSVLIMSGLIGCLKMVFQVDIFNSMTALLIHFVGTIILVSITGYVFHGFGSLEHVTIMFLFTNVFFIYLITLIALRLWNHLEVKRINDQIRKQRKQTNSKIIK